MSATTTTVLALHSIQWLSREFVVECTDWAPPDAAARCPSAKGGGDEGLGRLFSNQMDGGIPYNEILEFNGTGLTVSGIGWGAIPKTTTGLCEINGGKCVLEFSQAGGGTLLQISNLAPNVIHTVTFGATEHATEETDQFYGFAHRATVTALVAVPPPTPTPSSTGVSNSQREASSTDASTPSPGQSQSTPTATIGATPTNLTTSSRSLSDIMTIPSSSTAPETSSTAQSHTAVIVAAVIASVVTVSLALVIGFLCMRRSRRRRRGEHPGVRPYASGMGSTATESESSGTTKALFREKPSPSTSEPPRDDSTDIDALRSAMQRVGFSFNALVNSLNRVNPDPNPSEHELMPPTYDGSQSEEPTTSGDTGGNARRTVVNPKNRRFRLSSA